ncbi:MAG: hypothetical protein CVV27_09810 [Candidatus Melainabacteria bacterium HGW-Melainabacteria-1]|nr:MAG: hypothetical protein CVV27_09810 [Candidatus Melainabacteria bacterium HGW-Melainabacteria-1]
MTRFGTVGVACILGALALAQPALAQKRPVASATPDATPMPLPRFYARHVEEGNKLLAQNRITEAMDEFFTAKTINPDYYPTYVGLANAYEKMGQLEKAVENYQIAVRLLNPSYAAERILRGNYYAERNNYRLALRDYNDVVSIDPSAGNQYTLAMKHLRFSEDKKAIKAFEEATKLDEDFADPHFQLGNLYFRDNKLKKAVPSYEVAVKLDPRNPLYRFALGTALYKDATSKRDADLKTVTKATSEFESAMRLGMSAPRLHHNLGTCYLLTDKYDDAINHLRLAAKGGLQDPETFYTLGNALYRKAMTISYTWDGLSGLTDIRVREQNDTKFTYLIQAIKSYRLSQRLNDKNAQVYYDMAVAYYRLSELKLTEPFFDDITAEQDVQKDYVTRGVKYFQTDMLLRSRNNFNTFLSMSDNAKLKDLAGKLAAGVDRQLKDLSGR